MLTTSWPVIYDIYLRPDATGVDQKAQGAYFFMFILHIPLCCSGSPLCTTVTKIVRSAAYTKIRSTESFSIF